MNERNKELATKVLCYDYITRLIFVLLDISIVEMTRQEKEDKTRDRDTDRDTDVEKWGAGGVSLLAGRQAGRERWRV